MAIQLENTHKRIVGASEITKDHPRNTTAQKQKGKAAKKGRTNTML